MKEEELKLEDVEAPHALGGASDTLKSTKSDLATVLGLSPALDLYVSSRESFQPQVASIAITHCDEDS